jgi:hypothetical protein
MSHRKFNWAAKFLSGQDTQFIKSEPAFASATRQVKRLERFERLEHFGTNGFLAVLQLLASAENRPNSFHPTAKVQTCSSTVQAIRLVANVFKRAMLA